jgi:hypothetical protein
MPRGSFWIVPTVALLLEVLPLVAAHSDKHNVGGMVMPMSEAPRPPTLNSTAPASYWSLPEHTSLMYIHIALEVIAWFVVLPIGMLSKISRGSYVGADIFQASCSVLRDRASCYPCNSPF